MFFLFTLQLFLQLNGVLKSHTHEPSAGRFDAFLVWQWWMQLSVYGPLISADTSHWLHSQGFANVYHHIPSVTIHRSANDTCSKWPVTVWNLAGWSPADLTWLAVIKSACSFCTRRFMDFSSSSFLCWISSILVLWKQIHHTPSRSWYEWCLVAMFPGIANDWNRNKRYGAMPCENAIETAFPSSLFKVACKGIQNRVKSTAVFVW